MSYNSPPPRRPRDPCARLIITESRMQSGLVSIRPYPRNSEGSTLQEVLTDAGFEPGDVVELRIDHSTRIAEVQLPPPGQLMKRKRDHNRKR